MLGLKLIHVSNGYEALMIVKGALDGQNIMEVCNSLTDMGYLSLVHE